METSDRESGSRGPPINSRGADLAPVVVSIWEWGALPPASQGRFRTWSSQIVGCAGFLPHAAWFAVWCPPSDAA